MRPKRRQLTRKHYGRLTIIGKPYRWHHDRKVKVRCRCRTIKDVLVSSLLNGDTQSCGCLRREVLAALRRTHGRCKHPLYSVWNSMIYRCTNSNCKAYEDYGGRGITVCRAWRKFENFYKWAIKQRRGPGLTLDRRNNDRGYCPSNCRFATKKQQVANRRQRRDSRQHTI